jgi:uncharacterized membrane protein (DUF485 family)
VSGEAVIGMVIGLALIVAAFVAMQVYLRRP